MTQRAVHGLHIQHNILLLSMGSRSRHLAHIIHLIIAVNAVVLMVYIHTFYIYYIVLRILHTQRRKELFAEIHALSESFRGQQSRSTNFFIDIVVEMYYNFRHGGKRLHVSLFIRKHKTCSLILV